MRCSRLGRGSRLCGSSRRVRLLPWDGLLHCHCRGRLGLVLLLLLRGREAGGGRLHGLIRWRADNRLRLLHLLRLLLPLAVLKVGRQAGRTLRCALLGRQRRVRAPGVRRHRLYGNLLRGWPGGQAAGGGRGGAQVPRGSAEQRGGLQGSREEVGRPLLQIP